MPRPRLYLLLLLLALACAGCEKKADPLSSAQRFFQQIGTGQAKAAYESAAFGFQAQRSAAAFEAAAQEMGLTRYAGAIWEEPQIEGHTAKVGVRLQTSQGKELPLFVTLTKESGEWRVYSLRSPPSETTGISENRFTLVGKAPGVVNAVSQPIPPEAELRALVRENLLRFNEAIASQSFDAFYDSVSRKWQEQLTKGQLQRAFQPFIDQKVSLAGVATIDPIWDAPATVGTDGLLILSGHYPSEPYRTHFAIKLVYELPAWKLFGLEVNLRK